MAKGKSGENENKEAASPTHPEVIEPEVPQDIKHIRITLQAYKNITPLFSSSNLTVTAQYMESNLGCSGPTTIVDDDYFPTHHEFVVECDINSAKSLDKLISNPVIFTVFENPEQADAQLLAQLETSIKPHTDEIQFMSVESAADMLEAFTGKAVDRIGINDSETSKNDSKKGSKTNAKGSKGSVKEKDDKSKKDSKSKLDADKKCLVESLPEPVLIGTTAIDFLPLFFDQAKFTETLLLTPSRKFYDDNMIPKNITPCLMIEVSVDEDVWLENAQSTNVMSLTIECVYNIPDLMSEEMSYKTSMLLPSVFGKWENVIISGGKVKEKIDKYKLKVWPGMTDDVSKGSTKYRIDDCYETIKNPLDINLKEILNTESPRVEWNVLKRNFLTENAVHALMRQLNKYRRLPLELYVTSLKDLVPGSPPEPSTAKSTSKNKVKSDVSNQSDKKKKGESAVRSEPEDYLHLMAAVDASTLLYPGVNKCRVVCPLNTYQENEILEQAGLTNSYFMPKQEPPPVLPVTAGDKKKGDKGSAQAKSKSSKDSKPKSKGSAVDDTNKTDLKPLLPPAPVIILEPSIPVFSEKGGRTFILIEIELLKPLVPKREIEDLSEQLSELLPKRPVMNKTVVSSRLTQLNFKDVIKQLTDDLVHQHHHYAKEKELCKCDILAGMPQLSFLSFLQRTGVYQTYLMSVTKAASLIINDQFPFVGEASQSNKEYQNFIGKTYSSLIKEVNGILNELTCVGVENTSVSPLAGLDSLLLYAREACEIGALTLADRYYLERICKDDKSASSWFDYAIFQMEIGEKEMALECVQQCLLINSKHQYSLLLCGILLTEKKLYEEAETCFLTALFQKPNWLEAWATLHLFYLQNGNGEGADLCIQMANKSLKNSAAEYDYFNSIDDLIWTSATCPQTIFFKTAILLLKMRAFTFAEKALASEKMKKSGIYHYYLAVIMYYRQNYPHALQHLEEAEQLYGLDYGIGSLKGHCYLALEDLESAKVEYTRVLESFNRPDDVHLLYIYLALIWEKLNNKQLARKLLLLVCKFSPTPYTWLATGLLYFDQGDFLSADQCLIQANLCDNRLPEIWGYLVLVNLELERYTEAEMCYRQVKKNKMENQELAAKINKAMKTYKK